MRFKIHQIIFDIGAIVLGLGILSNYLQIIYITNLKTFLETAGPIFAGIAALCGLVLGWSSVIETEEDKMHATNASEKLLHATLYFVFSSLFAIGALKVGGFNTGVPWLFVTIKWIFIAFGFYFLLMALIACSYGISWLSDVLFTRWKRRDKNSKEEPKLTQIEESKPDLLESAANENEKIVSQPNVEAEKTT